MCFGGNSTVICGGVAEVGGGYATVGGCARGDGVEAENDGDDGMVPLTRFVNRP
ncbi:hypothetical protein Hanom_Chr17g01589511 [Helianthus anomalus]